MTNTPIYINGQGMVSPQKPLTPEEILTDPISYLTNQLKCPDPGFKDFIPSELIRRMGRIIKMGVTASKMCLQDTVKITGLEAGFPLNPQAIITGTGMGCIEDTEKFLNSMIKNKEEFLTPTSFIQSTHNTVAGQIALLLKCHSYNFTYVHRGISFESALMDAMTQIQTGEFENALVGGCDELTSNFFTITSRLGFWKRKPVDSLQLLKDTQRGSIAGEGATFLFLDIKKHDGTYAELNGVTTFRKPSSPDQLKNILQGFLSRHQMNEDDIAFALLGLGGDPATDKYYQEFIKCFREPPATGYFKHLCGEYHTASSFALGLAAMIIKTQTVPDVVKTNPSGSIKAVKNILIYNHYRGMNHSFTLLSQP